MNLKSFAAFSLRAWLGRLCGLNRATVRGSDRTGLQRFRSLPVALVEEAISVILDAHLAVAYAGYVSVDFYDGALVYDFADNVIRLIDLDEYRPGPFRMDDDRLPGSRSYMAPEEWIRGAAINERTMVFTLGRAISQLLTSQGGAWRGTPEQAMVAERATASEPEDRYPTVAALIAAWTRSTG